MLGRATVNRKVDGIGAHDERKAKKGGHLRPQAEGQIQIVYEQSSPVKSLSGKSERCNETRGQTKVEELAIA